MKIHPDQIKALEQEQAKHGRVQKTNGDEFGKLLAETIGKSEEASKTQGTAPTPPMTGLLPGQILTAQGTDQSGEPSQTGQHVMDTLENLLNGWENYAAKLGSPEATLRQADGELTSIENGIADIREKWPNLANDNPQAGAIVDEVEVLAVTERIKLNRGDYMA
ncbi:hypothetical protein JCM16814_20780 [Desulfobaculum senezii]|jgi:hypothetical protein|uniref:hypothetical protein n=1 Tax=Desulfobaculum sp. SPO524 TaxID=3378071 RepID=UPI0038523B7A